MPGRRLILIRHAEAEPAAASGGDDFARCLTSAGESRMRAVAALLLAQTGPLTRVMCSPLLRARQSAAILAEILQSARLEVVPALAPDASWAELDAWLGTVPVADAGPAALVGHMPGIADLACRFVNLDSTVAFAMPTAGAIVLEFSGALAPGMARPGWAEPARLAADLARLGAGG